MKPHFLILLAGAVFLGGLHVTDAHCPGVPPVEKITEAEPGTSITETCYPNFGTCFIDTFHSAELMEKLVAAYHASKHVVFAKVDSLRNYLVADTFYYRGQINYIDTFSTENFRIAFLASLKDTLPLQSLSFVDRWIAIPGNPFATTYSPLQDNPFVAFFNEYDSLEKIGIGPMDGCFFEPSAYMIHHGRIHKQGLKGERMPGISVTVEDFLKAVGHDPIPAPVAHVERSSMPKRVPTPGRNLSPHDLNGRRLLNRGTWRPLFQFWKPRPKPKAVDGHDNSLDGIRNP